MLGRQRFLTRGAIAASTVAVIVALSAAGYGHSSRHVAASAASAKCTTSIATEAPITGEYSQEGDEQLHFIELAVKMENKALGVHVALNQDDTQMVPSKAVSMGQAIISSPAVAVVGPSSSGEVEAIGPSLGRAGLAFVSGSATLPSLDRGKNPTFFRTVPDDNIQGPNDARYIVKHLHPKAVLIIDDDEAYSQGLVAAMIPVLKHAGIKVNHQTVNGANTGATMSSALASLVTAQLTPAETVTILPWQSAPNAQQFGFDAQQQHKQTIIFGTDGINSPTQFKIPGSYVSNFGPDISLSHSAMDRAILAGVKKYGPYGSAGVPSYAAAQVVMQAIANVCKRGATPTRSNVLTALRHVNIPPSKNPLGVRLAFAHNGNLKGSPGFLFKVRAGGKYVSIPDK
ncbi:MAG: branched-chain amino acid ABC transporter substrate-binding protein [Solirubrobacteraceae bacterium]